MSLHALANNMAAQGRGPDSTLVHMSPREVHGLQALAMANGGTLTINPQTGLPEAGFLDSLLPALIGFGLNTFVPGLGTAVGGMFGLGGAAGTAIAVGGAYGLATGSLEKGLTAGLGAYGGAGLGSSLAGVPNTAAEAGWGARDAGISAAAEASPAATAARLQAGANTAMSAPTDFLKSNYMNLGLAAAPALSGAFDEQTSSAPKIHPGYIRKYDRDPVTGTLYQVSATPADQYTGGINFGGVPEIQGVPPVKGYAQGGVSRNYLSADEYGRDFGDPNFGQPSERYEGITIQGGNDEYGNLNGSDANRRAMLRQPASLAPPNGDNYGPITTMPVVPDNPPVAEEERDETSIRFGGVGQLEPLKFSPTDLAMSDSQRVQNYLMGKGPNPFTVYHKEQKIAPIKKKKVEEKKVTEVEPRPVGGGEGRGEGAVSGGFPAGLAPAANTVALALGDMGLNALSHAVSNAAMSGAMSGSGAAAGSSTGPNSNATNSGMSNSGGWGSRDAGGGTAGGSSSGGSAAGKAARDGGGFGGTGSGVGGDGGSGGGGGDGPGSSSGSGGFGRGARGGYLNHGRFIQRYDEGGTTKKINFGGVGQLEPVNTSASDALLSDSQRTQNYLMGNGPNPFLFHHSNENKVIPETKPTDNTGIAAIGGPATLVNDNDGGISRLVDRSGDVSSIVNKSDTGGEDFGVTNQPPGAVFNINDFDAVNEFGIGSQPVGTTFDINDFNSDNGFSETGGQFGITGQPEGATFNINDFDNNTSAGVGDYGGKDFGVTGQPEGATFDINDFDNNTSAGTVSTGDSGSYTGGAEEGMDNVDTGNPEMFSQEYVDPRADPFEAAERLEQSEMNEGYTGDDFGSGYSDSGNGYGGYSDYGNDYGGGYSDYGIGGGGDYDMSYRAKGNPIKSNFKNARNINAYRSGLTNYADGGTTGSGSIDLHVPINIGGGGGGFGGGGGGFEGGRMGGGFGGMSQPSPNFLQQQMNSLPGFQSMQKAQQDFTNSDDYKNFQNYAQEYQQQFQPQQYSAFGGTMGGSRYGLGQANQIFGGLQTGAAPGVRPSYEQYLAGRSPYQQDVQLSREQYENPQQGPSTPGSRMAEGGIAALAQGGYNLGSYSDGGRLLRGPGDGVSDSIPATIGRNQPARLADGEFVVPARIVSELGNGSTEAGARKLYAMMDRVQKSRSKTTGKNRIAANTRADKYLPA